MKTIIVLGAGGSASTGFIRSLRLAPESFHIIGTDSNKFYLQRAESDETYLVPRADDKNYIPTLNKIILKTKAKFIHAQNDAEVATISAKKEEIRCRTFLPHKVVVKICQDKWKSRQCWKKAGIRHPITQLIYDEQTIQYFFKKWGGDCWIRDIKGAGGKGSLKTNTIAEAIAWVDYNNGWGHYTIAEYLSERSTTFTAIYWRGKLMAGQGRKRLYWELGPAFISGISGATGAGAIDNDPVVMEMALRAIKAIFKVPHGIYSVDMTYGVDGTPYPTEINIGRFFTTHHFFAAAGFNMAYIYTKLAFGEQVEVRINPLEEGMVWIRGMDFEPVLTRMEQINESEVE